MRSNRGVPSKVGPRIPQKSVSPYAQQKKGTRTVEQQRLRRQVVKKTPSPRPIIPAANSQPVIRAKTQTKSRLDRLRVNHRTRLLASSTRIEKGRGPRLPDSKSKTFLHGSYQNRQASGEEILYRYHGLNNQTGKGYTYISNKKFVTERELRDNMGILNKWGVKMYTVTTFQPPKGVWISEGVAAPQKGDRGENRPGGGYQAVIETDSLHPFMVTKTETLSKEFRK
jgi:hypothetical protein